MKRFCTFKIRMIKLSMEKITILKFLLKTLIVGTLEPHRLGGSNEYPQFMFGRLEIGKVGMPLFITILQYKVEY